MNRKETLELWMTLVNTKDAISRLRQKEMRPYRISAEQTGVLAILYTAQSSLTPAEISRRLIRDPSSVTVILQRMVSKGLIKKTRDKKKKNRKKVSMTKKGHDLYVNATRNMCIYELFPRLTQKQCLELKTCLEKLLNEAMSSLKAA